VAAAAAAGAQAPPIVDFTESPGPHPVASEPVGREEARDDSAGTKRRAQPAASEPAEKCKKPEPVAQRKSIWEKRRLPDIKSSGGICTRERRSRWGLRPPLIGVARPGFGRTTTR
jgi:hypothetical protein